MDRAEETTDRQRQPEAKRARDGEDGYRVAVLGDVHLYRILTFPWRLVGKRLLAQINLWVNRRFRFDRSLFPGVVERIRAAEPDALLLSGDLSTSALGSEFRDAARALEPLAEIEPTIMVPGNHDRYTYGSHLRKAMERTFTTMQGKAFPIVERLTPRWTVLAVDAAMPRRISARGRIGEGQMKRAADYLDSLGEEDGVIVLCHYPVVVPDDFHWRWTHRLSDREAWRQVLARCQARIVYVHGHIHQSWVMEPRDPELSHLIDLNAGAPCMVSPNYPFGQGFWEMVLPGDVRGEVRFVHHMATGVDGKDWHTTTYPPAAEPARPIITSS